MQFMKSSLDSLVRNLIDEDFKHLSEDYSSELLELEKEKRVHPYEYMNSFKYLMKINYIINYINALVKKNMTELLIFGMYLK